MRVCVNVHNRDLWVAHDAAGAGALKAQWNQHLLEQALPTCIAGARLVLRGSTPSSDAQHEMEANPSLCC